MADNVTLPATGTGTATPSIATDEIQVSGTGTLGHVQYVKLVDGTLNGTGAIGGDATNGLDVDVTRIAAGTNYIGKFRLTDGTNDITLETTESDTESNTRNRLPVESTMHVYNGSTWARLYGDATSGAFVQIKSDVPGTGATNSGKAVDAVAGATDTGTAALAVRIDTPATITPAAGDYTRLFTSSTGRLWTSAVVDTALPAGTNAIGNVGIIPRTTGGLTTYHLVSANSTNATVVKNSAGQLFGWYIYNNNTSMRKLAFHNASSTPTAGSSIFFTINVPGSSAANVFLESGIAFSTGISITTVTDVTDAGATAVGTSDLTINLFYA